MKQLLLFTIMALMSVASYAQSWEDDLENYEVPKDEDGYVTFTEVIDVAGASEEELFKRAQLWFADYYNLDDVTVQFSDLASGGIAAEANKMFESGPLIKISYRMNYSLRLLVKDGRYKYVLSRIHFYYEPENESNHLDESAEVWLVRDNLYKKNGKLKKNSLQFREDVFTIIFDVINSMKEGMEIQTIASSDDW